MFAKQKKNIAAVAEDNSVHDDLIIHNMPSPLKLSGSVGGDSFPGHSGLEAKGARRPADVKTTGLLIIISGLVFIGLLAYLSYIFVIRPMTEAAVMPALPGAIESGGIETAPVQDESGANAADGENLEGIDILSEEPVEVEASEEPSTIGEEVLSAAKSQAAPDSDNDGLSDQDEEVFGTDPLLADSDGDGYLDAAEIKAGYSPVGDGKIDGRVLGRLVNDTFGYALDFPAAWPKQSLNEGRLLVFTAPDESLIQIAAEENIEKASIINWYREAFPDDQLSYDRLLNGQGWEGILSDDGLNLYVTDRGYGRILVISFISSFDRLSYPFVFKLLADSLVLN